MRAKTLIARPIICVRISEWMETRGEGEEEEAAARKRGGVMSSRGRMGGVEGGKEREAGGGVEGRQKNKNKML